MPQKGDMSAVLYNRPQEASLWCILVMGSFNKQSKKKISRVILKTKPASLCQKTMRWAYPHCQAIPLFFLWKSLLPSPNLTHLSVQVPTSSEKTTSVYLFHFLYNSLDQIKTTMRYHFTKMVHLLWKTV